MTTPKGNVVDLSASQRKGAEERAKEASTVSAKAAAAVDAKHPHKALIDRAAQSAKQWADQTLVAGSVADAQYASRKAQEAQAAASWLYTQGK